MSIVGEAPGYLQVFSDGTVKRFAPPISPASTTASVTSMDVAVDESKPISARIFLPTAATGGAPLSRLPVVVYFHGGGFCIGSTTWCGYHQFLSDLCLTCGCVVVSVDYRLAPEHRLPAAYEDCYRSVEWLATQSSSAAGDGRDQWTGIVDLSRVFLSGESAGGNIAHHVMLRLVREPVGGVRVRGLLIIHPYFGSEARIEPAETGGEEAVKAAAVSDMFWRLSLPEGSDRDHPYCNVERVEVSEGEWRLFPPAAVFVAGRDLLRDRGTAYGAMVRGRGVEVAVEVAEEEPHAHNVLYPHSEGTRRLLTHMADFVTRCLLPTP